MLPAAPGLPLAFLELDSAEVVVILVVAVIFTAIGMAITLVLLKKKQAPEVPPDAARFAAALAPTPIANAKTAPGAPPPGAILDVTTGESTMAMTVVPDTSPAPMPGFAEIYKKIAAGQIRGHVMVVGGPDRGRGVEIDGARAISIGRGKHHTLNLNDPGVSTDQCEIVAANGKVMLRDLGSKNGTFVNNQRIEAKPQVLENCDIVTCGSTKILLTLGG